MNSYDVYLEDELIDTVFYDGTAKDCKKGLIEHDGYDPNIEIEVQLYNIEVEYKQKGIEKEIVEEDLEAEEAESYVNEYIMYDNIYSSVTCEKQEFLSYIQKHS